MSDLANKRLSAIASYHAGCLRAIGAQNAGLKEIRTSRKAAMTVDVGLLSKDETLLSKGQMTIAAPPETANVATVKAWETLRALNAKVAVESFQKEALYGAPMIGGVFDAKSTSNSAFAPLLVQAVDIVSNNVGAFSIKPKDEPPRFNSVVWKEFLDVARVEEVLQFGIELQSDIHEHGYSSERVYKFLEAVHGVVNTLQPSMPSSKLETWENRPTPKELRAASPYLKVYPGAALYIANKASPFLLHDLQQISVTPETFLEKETPLSIFIGDPENISRPEPEALQIDQVGFPFPSNLAQRKVSDAIEKNSIVVVQGPPGNGKSLTIANIVCDLVSKGKKVLVTSHKDQALTVVQDKLSETKLKFLYASLIGSTGAAKKALQGQIQDIKAFNGASDSGQIIQQLEMIKKGRAESGRLYSAHRDMFIKQAEEQQAEAAQLLDSLEGVKALDHRDPVIEPANYAENITALENIDKVTRENKSILAWLSASPLDASHSAEASQLLNQFIKLQDARVKAAASPAILELIAKWSNTAETFPEQIITSRKALEASAGLVEPFNLINEFDSSNELWSYAVQTASAPEVVIQDLIAKKVEIEKLFSELIKYEGFKDITKTEPIFRNKLIAKKETLEEDKMLTRGKTKKWFEENALDAINLPLTQLEAWRDYWDIAELIDTQNRSLPALLHIKDYDSASVANALKKLEGVIMAATRIDQFESPESQMILTIEELAANQGLTVNREIWKVALGALESDRDGNQIRANPLLGFVKDYIDSIDNFIDIGQPDKATKELDKMRQLGKGLQKYTLRQNLLESTLLKYSAEIVIANAVDELEPPAFLGDMENSLKAQTNLKKLAEIQADPSTRQLSEQISKMRETVLEDNRKLLELEIQNRIKQGFMNPSFITSLETFKKSLRAAAKKGQEIEALKNSSTFNIDVLTDVFPCWIMRPDDVCRNFPLQKDIFDVVIFDEASQCNPDQSLPLFARAKSVAIFGDEKQLPNMVMLGATENQTLLTQSNVPELGEDIEYVFDQTKNSLLGLVESRTQASLVLDEHFRCRPEIIAYSNKEYYGSSLRVMRDVNDDAGLGPAFLIKEVTGVPLTNIFEHLPTESTHKFNPYEAHVLVDYLKQVIDDPKYKGMTIGVLSVFRDQIEYLAELVAEAIPEEVRESRRITCSTADGFQGDERDVILYSWRFSGANSNILTHTSGENGDRRLNVALTRARHQAIHFISAGIEEFPQSRTVTAYLRHSDNPLLLLEEFERQVYHAPLDKFRTYIVNKLKEQGLLVKSPFIAGGVSIDIAVKRPEDGAVIGVYVDSSIDRNAPVNTIRRVDAHMDLERSGWQIVRIPSSEIPMSRFLGDINLALDKSQRKITDKAVTENYNKIVAPSLPDWRAVDSEAEPVENPDDTPDYNWQPGSVPERLREGEELFQSDFERKLYERLVVRPNVQVCPQWPAAGKVIDLVVTDNLGRRIAVEADGEYYHQDEPGVTSEEDIERQKLLEGFGWEFHRVASKRFEDDPEREVEAVLKTLAKSKNTRPHLTGFNLTYSVEQADHGPEIAPEHTDATEEQTLHRDNF